MARRVLSTNPMVENQNRQAGGAVAGRAGDRYVESQLAARIVAARVPGRVADRFLRRVEDHLAHEKWEPARPLGRNRVGLPIDRVEAVAEVVRQSTMQRGNATLAFELRRRGGAHLAHQR